MSRQSATPTWRDLEIGCATIEPGSSKYNRTGDWRSSRPNWDLDKCVKCGVCMVFCPEGCISMRKDGYAQVDLEFCKGCGICVTECWTACIEMQEETE